MAKKKPSPSPESVPLPRLPADIHLKAVVSYIEQIESRMDRGDQDPEELLKLAENAAHHLARARSADPTATIAIDTKEGPKTVDQDLLAVNILNKEGRLCVAYAETTPLQDSNKYLERAKSAWEQALAYRQDADFHFRIAHVNELLGNKLAATQAANKALKIDPGHIESVKLHDRTNQVWRPKYKPDRPELTDTDLKEPFGWWPLSGHWTAFIAGVLIIWISTYFTGMWSLGGFIVGALCLVIGFFMWRSQDSFTQSKVSGSYQVFKDQQQEAETERLMGQSYAARYARERDAEDETSRHNRRPRV